MAWSQLGYKLYCFKQWYSPLTEACITQFQWLWVKYILIKMCKKWYPTEGLAVRLSKFFNINKSPHLKIPKSKSPHFFHVSHFLSPNSTHFFRIISMFSLHFFNSAFSPPLLCGDPQKIAEKMRNSAKDADIWGTGHSGYQGGLLCFCTGS